MGVEVGMWVSVGGWACACLALHGMYMQTHRVAVGQRWPLVCLVGRLPRGSCSRGSWMESVSTAFMIRAPELQVSLIPCPSLCMCYMWSTLCTPIQCDFPVHALTT